MTVSYFMKLDDKWKCGYTSNPDHINHVSNKPYELPLKPKFQNTIIRNILILLILSQFYKFFNSRYNTIM